MQQTTKPVSKVRVILMWVILVGYLIFWIGFVLWRHRDEPGPAESGPDFARAIVFLVLGAISLIVGVGAYFLVLFTNCFTFNFTRPVWTEMKAKIYFANIFVPLGWSLGLGLAASAFFTPVLLARGIRGTMATMIPVFAMVALAQVAQFWVLIWSPLDKRVITKRLLAQGITPVQLQSGMLVGLSDATRSSFKKFGAIEDDIGALWVSPEQLVYWGDGERFSIARDQLVQLERKADTGSTTMLTGATHPILHVRLPDGSERQIRLHAEGQLTRGSQHRAIDRLADEIIRWHGEAVPAPSA